MRTEHFYKIVIIVLLLLNLGTLGYMWLRNDRGSHHDGPPRPDEMIRTRLQLDAKQEEAFEGFRDEHHSQMMQIQEASSKLHQSLFMLLRDNTVDKITKDSLLQEIQTLNARKEEVTFTHFQKLRSILTPEQKLKFDDFVEELSMRIMGPHKPGRS